MNAKKHSGHCVLLPIFMPITQLWDLLQCHQRHLYRQYVQRQQLL